MVCEVFPMPESEMEYAAELLASESPGETLLSGPQQVTLDRHLAGLRAAAQRGMLLYSVRANGQFAGLLSLSRVDHVVRSAELGCVIAPQHRHQGYGALALRLLLDRVAFGELNLNRVYGQTLETNVAARRWFLKAGFVEEGLVSEDVHLGGGRFVGSVQYGRLRTDGPK